jgi:hypothetical protein
MGWEGGGGGQGEEMTQTMCTHVNKWIIIIINRKQKDLIYFDKNLIAYHKY